MLQLPASKLGSPDLELLMSESTVNKVVQQIGGLTSPFSLELLIDGLSITLLPIPINHSSDEITFYGIISGTDLFSDSTHSIKQCFHPSDASFALSLPSLHHYCFIPFPCSSLLLKCIASLGKNGTVYYLLQFPREVLNESPRFMLLPTFTTQIFGFSMGKLDRFLFQVFISL